MSYLVIKCGGSMLNELPQTFYENIVTLVHTYQLKPIIVHGGGPMISSTLDNMNVQTSFVDGMRVTTEEELNVVEMVLSGSVNKQIVRNIQLNGGHALGLSGVDGNILEAEPLKSSSPLGYVGTIRTVKTGLIKELLAKGRIPVISPMGTDCNGQRWNINADMTAAAIAKAFEAPLYMITNVSGVLKNGRVIPYLRHEQVSHMVMSGEIYGGMIPKVQAALDCKQKGIKRVSILNGKEPESLLNIADGKEAGTSFILE